MNFKFFLLKWNVKLFTIANYKPKIPTEMTDFEFLTWNTFSSEIFDLWLGMGKKDFKSKIQNIPIMK